MNIRNPATLSSAVETPEVRHRRSMRQIMGFEAYQVLAVAIVGILVIPFWSAFVIAFIVACGLQPVIRASEKRMGFYHGNAAFFIVSLLCAAMVGMVGYTTVRVARLTVEFAAPLTGQTDIAGSAKSDDAKKKDSEESTGTPAARTEARQTDERASEDASKAEHKDSKSALSPKNSLQSLDEMREKLQNVVAKVAPSYGHDVEAFLNALPKTAVTWIAGHAQDFVSNTFEILTQLAFFFIFLFLFLSKGRSLMTMLLKKKRDVQPRIKLWYDIVETASFTSVVSTAAIGFIQATIVTVSCKWLGYPEWGLIFFVCFILSFVPVLGPATIPFILAASAFIGGDTTTGLWLTALAVFAGTIDNLLRPAFVSAEHDINPLLSFISMVGAISIFGVAGLLLGPFLVTLSALLLGDKSKEGFRPL